MPKVLSQFRSGVTVGMACYHFGCEGVSIRATLGDEGYIHPGFNGSERIHWPDGTPVKSFHLAEHRDCPKCNARFVKAIVVFRGRGVKPTIFGYEAEGA